MKTSRGFFPQSSTAVINSSLAGHQKMERTGPEFCQYLQGTKGMEISKLYLVGIKVVLLP